ncbi:hypothetical protein QTI66_06195 [Variovorax sp. J22R133]|uniref:polyhydroxyalkanoate granule-associated phasin n=1 Tax=Variovorax brevis TaxID=3053503 RepID=UPI002575FDDA|nr:polyhydroxyalkanoate granule-associated phasin [Variovorax sp. J22R133]MDM0111732.1 hypothetical protein [Variovorax sp. J22R133]
MQHFWSLSAYSGKTLFCPPSSLPMSSTVASRFFNPVVLWADVASKTGDMLVASGTVIRIRTDRLLRTALQQPSPSDVEEFSLMGHEKLAAVSESGTAMVSQLHATQFALTHRTVRHCLQAGEAMSSMMISTTPLQAAKHAHRFLRANTQSTAALTQLASAAARVVQRGLKPFHTRAASNALRLTGPAA